MGCIVSSKKQTLAKDQIPVLRRRLTLGDVDDEDEKSSEPGDIDLNDSDRSLLLDLTTQQALDFVATDKWSGRKFSIGTETDQQGSNVPSFGSKTTKLAGEKFDDAKQHVGYACKKGLKPEAPNQDSFLIMKIEDRYALYGVFDGHGRKGHDVSNFIKDLLPRVLFSQKEIETDPGAALLHTFATLQSLLQKATAMKLLDATRSGSTCSVVLHMIKQNMIYIAHVGDSRVVLGRRTPAVGDSDSYDWQARDLTIDHKPDLPEERARIEQAGGVVVFDGGWNYRVFAKGKRDARGKRYPGLNMSRAMGDLQGFNDAGISALPDIRKSLVGVSPTAPQEDVPGPPGQPFLPKESELSSGLYSNAETADTEGRQPMRVPSVSSHGIDPQTDKFVLLCSDGVWEFIASETAVKEVGKFTDKEATPAAEHLCACAWDNWMREMGGQVVDDITAVVVHFSV